MMVPVDRLWRRAQGYLAAKQTVSARAALDAMVSRDPTHIHAHLILGGIAWANDRMRDATRHALDAASVVPDDATLLGAVIAALLQVGEHAAARACLQRPPLAHANDGALLMQLAGWNQMLGEHAASLHLYERAHGAGVDGPEYRFRRATQFSFNGRLREAEAELEHCVRMGAATGRAYVELARLRRQTPQRNHLELLEHMLAHVQPGTDDRAGLEFARYKELEDIGRHDDAWDALANGNALMAARARHDPAREERLLDALLGICTPAFLKSAEMGREGPQPIFIVGMTRSGTTVLDQMLGNHSQIASAGELRDFGWQLRWAADSCTQHQLDERIVERLPNLDYAEIGRRYLAQTQWRARGKPFFVDKLPSNWQLAGLIHRALPQARILHLVRDPMDVCFSNFRALFGDAFAWSYDLNLLAQHYLQYRRVMEHWHAVLPGRILDVRYAEMVRDPETALRRVLNFCRLPCETGCADLTRNAGVVATLSMVQVRSPMHGRAFGEWRPYATQLAPLCAKLMG
jgi:tetratricopeptide (TPR) repeat protein